eukprot:2173358-Prymnesium_polylepis.1
MCRLGSAPLPQVGEAMRCDVRTCGARDGPSLQNETRRRSCARGQGPGGLPGEHGLCRELCNCAIALRGSHIPSRSVRVRVELFSKERLVFMFSA